MRAAGLVICILILLSTCSCNFDFLSDCLRTENFLDERNYCVTVKFHSLWLLPDMIAGVNQV